MNLGARSRTGVCSDRAARPDPCRRPRPAGRAGRDRPGTLPSAWINTANPGRGDGAQATLAIVPGYVGAVIIESACAGLPVSRDVVEPDGLIADPSISAGMAAIYQSTLRYLRTNPI